MGKNWTLGKDPEPHKVFMYSWGVLRLVKGQGGILSKWINLECFTLPWLAGSRADGRRWGRVKLETKHLVGNMSKESREWGI